MGVLGVFYGKCVRMAALLLWDFAQLEDFLMIVFSSCSMNESLTICLIYGDATQGCVVHMHMFTTVLACSYHSR